MQLLRYIGGEVAGADPLESSTVAGKAHDDFGVVVQANEKIVVHYRVVAAPVPFEPGIAA